MVPAPVGHRMVHAKATVDGPEWYRSGDADDGDMLAIRASDTVDGAQWADPVRHGERAEASQPRVAVRRIRGIQLVACAHPFQRAGVVELLQQLEVVIAGNTEQMPNPSFLQAAKQEVSN